MRGPLRMLRNGTSLPLEEVPHLPLDDFLQGVMDAVTGGDRVVSFFGAPADRGIVLYAVLASKNDTLLGIMSTATEESFPSLSNCCPDLQLFEREIAEQFGVVPEGHPWLKPVRFHHSFRPGHDAWGRNHGEAISVGVMDFYRVDGEGVHEVAVGPVHAGIIEPGHFRFQCHGEKVFHLEISLGYQHRGIETELLGGPHPRSIYQMETIAGDTTIGHALAYCMLIEGLSGASAPPRADALRGVALELERVANHTGDLGAIANDVGYLPTSSFCGRIRGDFLNMTACLCGSRFGRGMVRPGGTGFDCSTVQAADLLKRLAETKADLQNAVDLLWHSSSVMARLEQTGILHREQAEALGLVGPAARASGLSCDVRRDQPFGIFRTRQIPVVLKTGGDVLARTLVRWLETENSLDFIAEQLRDLPAGGFRINPPRPGSNRVAIALTEGWRGEICHVAITDRNGRFSRYKITDPSFHNWSGLALALRNEQISDFPLCNKSFNLSYCGFDL